MPPTPQPFSALLSPSQTRLAFLSLCSFSVFLSFYLVFLIPSQPLGPSQPFSILLSLSRPSLSPSPPYSVILFLSLYSVLSLHRPLSAFLSPQPLSAFLFFSQHLSVSLSLYQPLPASPNLPPYLSAPPSLFLNRRARRATRAA